jgi:choline dehydrogenase-like flavoprotein
MLIDARALPQQHVIDTDVCIIGGGAAGVTLARSLAPRTISICLLESGGFGLDPQTQSLYQGMSEGTLIGTSRGYLSRSRLRYFGGSTNHWTGFCRPLDDDDFETRAWIPHSGWPFGAAELARFYVEAARELRIEPFAGEAERDSGTASGIFPEASAVITRRYHMSSVRFGRQYREVLPREPNVTVVIYANATAIEATENGSRVIAVRVATLTGKRFAVRARCYVLAAGGVENARLLLVSDGVQKAGLGNGRDLVGRFFMDHVEGGVGFLVLTDRLDAIGSYAIRDGRMSALCLSAATRRAHELLNASVGLDFRTTLMESGAGGTPLAIGDTLARIDRVREAKTDEAPQARYARCIIHGEPSPDPESRVTLDHEVDALGLRRAKLDWKLAARDGESMWRTLELVSRELGKRRLGRGLVMLDAKDPWQPPLHEANHHIGTTRMGTDAATSVVNADGQVHGIANLYVAGSSVFPTAGCANPTLTIVALALKLGEHLPTALARA